MKWLKTLLGLCTHKWIRVQIIDVFYTDQGKRITEHPAFTKHVLQCQNCGNEKVVKI